MDSDDNTHLLEFLISNDDNDNKNNNNNIVDNLFENIEQFFTNIFLKNYFETIKKNK